MVSEIAVKRSGIDTKAAILMSSNVELRRGGRVCVIAGR